MCQVKKIAKDVLYRVFQVVKPVETEADLENPIYGFNPEEKEATRAGIPGIAKENQNFLALPKIWVDFVNGIIYTLYFPIFEALEKLAKTTRRFIPLGLSIVVKTSDNKVIALQRSSKNRSCKGFLSLPAAFMTFGFSNFATREMSTSTNFVTKIIADIIKILKNELGLLEGEYKWDFKDPNTMYVVKNDYPSNQDEIIIIVTTKLTAKQVIARAEKNKADQGLPSENNVFMLNKKTFLYLLSLEIPGATAHLAALCIAFGLDPEVLLANYPTHPSTEEFKNSIKTLIMNYQQ